MREFLDAVTAYPATSCLLVLGIIAIIETIKRK